MIITGPAYLCHSAQVEVCRASGKQVFVATDSLWDYNNPASVAARSCLHHWQCSARYIDVFAACLLRAGAEDVPRQRQAGVCGHKQLVGLHKRGHELPAAGQDRCADGLLRALHRERGLHVVGVP